LFVRTIRKFLVNLKRHHADLYQNLGDVAVRYEAKNDGRFAVKPSESSRKFQEVGDDCFLLMERFKDHDAIIAMDRCRLLRAQGVGLSDAGDGDLVAGQEPAGLDYPCQSRAGP